MPVVQVKSPGNVIQISGLKYFRLKKKISIRKLAKMIGKDEKLIRKLEKKNTGARETIEKICKILRISQEQFSKIIEIDEDELDNLEDDISREKINKKSQIKNDILFRGTCKIPQTSGFIDLKIMFF